MLPLDGVRVLDASHVIAGPYASYQLGLLGADVIRIDRVKGNDFVRYHGGTPAMRAAGLGASYISQNAGKACIQLNLQDARGVALFKRLAATADVVLENFRPGVMDRLGLGYDAIRGIKPNIIYCSLTGYGTEGPLRNAPAYDHIMQGVSGLMSTTGTPETGPLRSGVPITDYLAGIHGAFAMLAALYHRQASGEGQHLHVSMLAATLPVLGAVMTDYQTTGNLRDLMGNQPFSDSPFAGRFDTAEGQIVVTANTAAQTRQMLAALDITSLDDTAEAMTAGRALSDAQREQASAMLKRAFLNDTADGWVSRLTKVSVPAGKVNGIDDVMTLEQIEALDCLDTVDVAGADTPVRVPGLAFRSDTSQKRPLAPPEAPGQSTRRILRELLQLDAHEMTTLAADGVIAGNGLGDG